MKDDARMYTVVRAGCAHCGTHGSAFAPLYVGTLDAPDTLTARCQHHAAALRCVVARACVLSTAAARAVVDAPLVPAHIRKAAENVAVWNRLYVVEER